MHHPKTVAARSVSLPEDLILYPVLSVLLGAFIAGMGWALGYAVIWPSAVVTSYFFCNSCEEAPGITAEAYFVEHAFLVAAWLLGTVGAVYLCVLKTAKTDFLTGALGLADTGLVSESLFATFVCYVAGAAWREHQTICGRRGF